MSDFSKKKSHEENIKVSIDQILGSNTVLKRSKKTAEDHRRANFINIIHHLEGITIRDAELNMNYMLDMDKYNTPFFEVIDNLFSLAFTKHQVELIYFYLYDRITPEGFYIQLEENGVPIPMDNPEQLYEAILTRK